MMNVAAEEDAHAAAGTENFALNNVKKKCIRFWEIVFGDFCHKMIQSYGILIPDNAVCGN